MTHASASRPSIGSSMARHFPTATRSRSSAYQRAQNPPRSNELNARISTVLLCFLALAIPDFVEARGSGKARSGSSSRSSSSRSKAKPSSRAKPSYRPTSSSRPKAARNPAAPAAAACPPNQTPAAVHQPAVHQQAVHQQAVHQQAVHQQAVHQPAVHQPAEYAAELPAGVPPIDASLDPEGETHHPSL